MKIIRIPLAVAAVFSLGVVGVAPAFAEGGHVHRPPQQHVAKGQSAPGATTRAALAAGNDDLASAQFLPSANNSVSGSTMGATAEPGEQSHGDQFNAASNSIWYRWTASATGHVIFRTIGSNYDTVMAAYQPARGVPATVANLTQVAANDDLVLDNSTTASQVRFDVVAGLTYFIAVDGFGPAVGNVKLTWTTNDDFAAAQVLADPPVGGFSTFAVHNEGTKPEIGEPRHAGKVSTSSVWYAWSPSRSGVAEFQTTQSNLDPVLAVYTGSRVDSLTEVASNDDLAPGVHRSQVRFFAKAGTTYKIVLAGFGGQTGFEVVNYRLTKPEIIAGDATTAEGTAGSSRTVSMPVRLTTASPSTVGVHFATADATAKAGSDYTAASGTLTFVPGETTKSVAVTVRGDATKEPAETFTLKLTSPNGGFTIADAAGTATITNDD